MQIKRRVCKMHGPQTENKSRYKRMISPLGFVILFLLLFVFGILFVLGFIGDSNHKQTNQILADSQTSEAFENGTSELESFSNLMNSFEISELNEIINKKDYSNANRVNLNGVTPLMVAAYFGKEQVLVSFLARGADENARDRYGHTPLMYAVCSPKSIFLGPNLAATLVSVGARIDEQDFSEYTALMYASIIGNTPAAKLLLENGANPHLSGRGKVTAFSLATSHSNFAILELLKSYF